MALRVEIDHRSLCVFCQIDDDGSHRAFGSGFFFMKSNLVVTARHVIDDVITSRRPTYIMNGPGRGAKPINRWAHPDPGIDLALVQCDDEDLNAPHVPLFPAGFQHNRSEGAIAIGYCAAKSNAESKSWTIQVNHVQAFAESRRDRGRSTEWVLEFQNDWMAGGFSGGPVLSLGGGVIGVLIQSFGTDTSSNSGVDLRHGRATSILPLLDYFRSPFE